MNLNWMIRGAGTVLVPVELQSEGLYDFATSRGDISLYLPETVSATVTAGTVSGEFVSDFETGVAPVRGEKFSFTLGAGAARVELITHTGSLALYRSQ